MGPTAGQNTTLLLGDFHCPNHSWGYNRTAAMGRKLEALSNTQHMSFLNDASYPTRQGTTQETDTNPDLTWIRGDHGACWDNTTENLGSNHRIVRVPLTPRHRAKLPKPQFARATHIMDRHKARMTLECTDKAHQDYET